MSRSNLRQDVLQDASAGIARSISEIGDIQSDIRFTEPLAARRLVKQTNQLKIALKDVEKLRLLWAEPQAHFEVSSISKMPQSLPSKLSKIVRRVQYEAAKIEVLEMMFLIVPTPETEAARNMVFTLRKSLYDACETCISSDFRESDTPLTDLRNIVSSVNCFLEQMANNCASDNHDTRFLREMLMGIVAKLTSLNTDLNNHQKQIFRTSTSLSNLDIEREIAGLWQ